MHRPYDYRELNDVENYWYKYEGEFHKDCRHGFGTLYLTNGESYSGSFNGEFISGEGEYTTINGDII